MSDPADPGGPWRLTPTVVELVALVTVGGTAGLIVLALAAALGDGWSWTALLAVPAGIVLGACTVVIWRRTPMARVAAIVGLVTVVVLAGAVSLSDGLSPDPWLVIPLVPLAMLVVDRRAFPEAGLRRRDAARKRPP